MVKLNRGERRRSRSEGYSILRNLKAECFDAFLRSLYADTLYGVSMKKMLHEGKIQWMGVDRRRFSGISGYQYHSCFFSV
jgi:hypothetical protein